AGSALGDFVVGTLSTIWTIAVFNITTLVLFFQLDFGLAAIVLVWMAVVFVLARYFLPRLRHPSAAVAEPRANLKRRMVDVQSTIQTVKLVGTRDARDSCMREGFERHLDAALSMGRLSISLRSLRTLTSGIAFAAVAVLCSDLWVNGRISVGSVA